MVKKSLRLIVVERQNRRCYGSTVLSVTLSNMAVLGILFNLSPLSKLNVFFKLFSDEVEL